MVCSGPQTLWVWELTFWDPIHGTQGVSRAWIHSSASIPNGWMGGEGRGGGCASAHH